MCASTHLRPREHGRAFAGESGRSRGAGLGMTPPGRFLLALMCASPHMRPAPTWSGGARSGVVRVLCAPELRGNSCARRLT
jgi:hypothetical protein